MTVREEPTYESLNKPSLMYRSAFLSSRAIFARWCRPSICTEDDPSFQQSSDAITICSSISTSSRPRRAIPYGTMVLGKRKKPVGFMERRLFCVTGDKAGSQ